ncbi:hypothetical protein [Bacillus toyonensis]|uniref:DUF3906 domain-containing protein n=1 Tax=Bacillus toyonensis TaxID=155322 RepID=A0A2A8H7T6_9BACI|nr:hypothetical protein [Bacillus toyonensis]PEP88913.1 hypothetical protein CN585_29045 [Bacillus toyonensis]
MEKYPVEFTIISPNGEVYKPDIVYVSEKSPEDAVKQVENEIKQRMGKWYTYKVEVVMPNKEEQLSLF